MKKLNPNNLGLAFGIAWGLFMMILAKAGWIFGVGIELIEVISSFYTFYSPSFSGVLLGFMWGLISGYLWGFIIGKIYNTFSS